MSVSSSRFSRDSMSNQAGILKPRFSVMGITGAVGQITLRWSGRIVLRMDAQPWPVSPRPCRNIMEAVCLILGFSTTGLVSFDIPLRREALLIEKTKSWESDIFRRAPNSSRLVASASKVGLLGGRDPGWQTSLGSAPSSPPFSSAPVLQDQQQR